MVSDVGNFWLDYTKGSRNLLSFHVFLDKMELEPADIIDLTHPLGRMNNFVTEILKIRSVLGSANRNILDRLEILAVENTDDILAPKLTVLQGISLTDGDKVALEFIADLLSPQEGASLTVGDEVTILIVKLDPQEGASLTDGGEVALFFEGGSLDPQEGASLTDGDEVTLLLTGGPLDPKEMDSISFQYPPTLVLS